jgi:hypothetical protein
MERLPFQGPYGNGSGSKNFLSNLFIEFASENLFLWTGMKNASAEGRR